MSNYKNIYDYAERPPVAAKIRSMTGAQLYAYLLDMASATLMGGVPAGVNNDGYGQWRLYVEQSDNPTPEAPSDWVFVAVRNQVRIELYRGGRMTMRSSACDSPDDRLRYIPVAHVMFALVNELNTEMFPVLYDHEGNSIMRTRIANSGQAVMVDLNDMQIKPISNMGYSSGAWLRDNPSTPWKPPTSRGHYHNPAPLEYSYIETKERNKVRAVVKELVQYTQMLAMVDDDDVVVSSTTERAHMKASFYEAVRDMLRGMTLLDATDKNDLTLHRLRLTVSELLDVGYSTGALRSIDVAKLKYEKFDSLAVDVAGVRKKFDRLYLTNPTMPLAKWREVLPSIR